MNSFVETNLNCSVGEARLKVEIDNLTLRIALCKWESAAMHNLIPLKFIKRDTIDFSCAEAPTVYVFCFVAPYKFVYHFRLFSLQRTLSSVTLDD